MSRAEEFIKEHTRTKVNHITEVFPWITTNDAQKVIEIARKETLQEVKRKLSNMLQTSIDNKHFFEQLDDYIEELEEAMKDET